MTGQPPSCLDGFIAAIQTEPAPSPASEPVFETECWERDESIWIDGPGPIPFGMIVRTRCGTYACPPCGRRKVAKLRRRLVVSLSAWFAEGQRGLGGTRWEHAVKFLTLTCAHRAFPSPEDAVEAMAKGWNKLRTLLVKRYGPIPFFRVWELHKDGYPHLHILMFTSRFIPWRWIAEKWERYHIGRNIDIRNKTDGADAPRGAAHYLTKYILKGLGLKRLPFSRRWGCSRGFLLQEERRKWWDIAWYDGGRTVEQAADIKLTKGAWVKWWRGRRDGFDWAMPGASCGIAAAGP